MDYSRWVAAWNDALSAVVQKVSSHLPNVLSAAALLLAGWLAARLLREASGFEARLQRLAILLFARPLMAEEIAMASQFLANVTPKLRETGAAEQELEVAAWAACIRSFFRMNEFVYVD